MNITQDADSLEEARHVVTDLRREHASSLISVSIDQVFPDGTYETRHIKEEGDSPDFEGLWAGLRSSETAGTWYRIKATLHSELYRDSANEESSEEPCEATEETSSEDDGQDSDDEEIDSSDFYAGVMFCIFLVAISGVIAFAIGGVIGLLVGAIVFITLLMAGSE